MAYAQGLRPIGSAANAQTFTVQTCEALDDYATNMFVGDPVSIVAAGVTARTASTTHSAYDTGVGDGVYPTVEVGIAGGEIFGVIVGFEPQFGNLSQQYGPASTNRIVRVCVPTTETLFIVGEDAAGAALTLADVGQMRDLVAGTGSTTTGYSGWVINSDVTANAAALNLHIRGIYNEPGNVDKIGTTGTAPDIKWIVSIAEHQFAVGTVGTFI